MTAQQDEMPSEPRSDIERVLCTGDEICQHCDVIYGYITDIGIYAVRMKQRAESAESRLAALRESAQFVIENLPGTLFNSLGRTSYDYGEQARKCAERNLVKLRDALKSNPTGRE